MNTYYSPINLNSDESYRQILFYQEKAKQERREIRYLSNMLGLAILAFEIMQVVFSFVLYAHPNLKDLYETSSVFQDSATVICVELLGVILPFGLVALFNRKRFVGSIVPNEKIGFSKGLRWVAFGMLGCIAADYITEGVIVIFNHFGYDLDYPESLVPNSVFACIINVIAVAVIPALCEEFAMRCCSLGLMRRYGKAFGVVSVSIVFGLLHGNVVQFVFAGIVGLFLAYVTVKTDNIWPAVFIHGLNNGISSLGSIAEYIKGDEVGDWFYISIFVFWIVAGIIGAAWIFLKGEFKSDEPKSAPLPYANSFGAKLGAFASAPLLLLSLPFLIWATFSSIVPIK